MKLFFRKYGAGKPLIILHGLFGQSDNWNTLSKKFAENSFEVYTLDLRNHGLSPHSTEWSYELMAQDIKEFIEEHKLQKPFLVGHSLGGKVLMFFEMMFRGIAEKLVVVDMAPRAYPPHHNEALKALMAVDLEKISSRKEAENKLNEFDLDFGTKQFLLKNLYRLPEEEIKNTRIFDWRFNLKTIHENYAMVGQKIPEGKSLTPVLFLRGERSDYILPSDEAEIKKYFPNAEIKTVQDAGHWIHAEKPLEFFNETLKFLQA
jgi:esterase